MLIKTQSTLNPKLTNIAQWIMGGNPNSSKFRNNNAPPAPCTHIFFSSYLLLLPTLTRMYMCSDVNIFIVLLDARVDNTAKIRNREFRQFALVHSTDHVLTGTGCCTWRNLVAECYCAYAAVL